MNAPTLILIAGPSGSGKSTVAQGLSDRLREMGHGNIVISLDNYYRDLSHLPPEERRQWNFDEPSAWEQERIVEDAKQLKLGQAIEAPEYDFSTHLRKPETTLIRPQEFIIMEGLFALCSAPLNALSDLKVFVELDNEIALERRILRDTRERGRSKQSVIDQFRTTVAPANKKFIQPSANFADIRVSGNDVLSLQLEEIIRLI